MRLTLTARRGLAAPSHDPLLWAYDPAIPWSLLCPLPTPPSPQHGKAWEKERAVFLQILRTLCRPTHTELAGSCRGWLHIRCVSTEGWRCLRGRRKGGKEKERKSKQEKKKRKNRMQDRNPEVKPTAILAMWAKREVTTTKLKSRFLHFKDKKLSWCALSCVRFKCKCMLV